MDKACVRCGAIYHTHNSARKYCGLGCSHAAKITHGKTTKARILSRPKKAKRVMASLVCHECGKQYEKRADQANISKYCCWACKSAAQRKLTGPLANGWKPASQQCGWCKSIFKNGNKKTRFCSPECFYVWERATYGDGDMGKRHGSRVDRNQKEIMAALEAAGVCVVDTSQVRGGCPDLLVSHGGETIFMEVKNPEWSYGRAGLTKIQKAFSDGWNGKIYVVTTPAEALAVFGIGDGKCPPDVSCFGRLTTEDRENLRSEFLSGVSAMSS